MDCQQCTTSHLHVDRAQYIPPAKWGIRIGKMKELMVCLFCMKRFERFMKKKTGGIEEFSDAFEWNIRELDPEIKEKLSEKYIPNKEKAPWE